jgi:LPPG:FO 2-phospho-L-lactate transferase
MLSKHRKVSGVITVLSGGVGAARLLQSLLLVVPAEELTAVVNVGDDLVLHGLTICPDLDTITYTLAGLNNQDTGWGLAGESWRVMAELERLGGDSWFSLGDRDLATHLYRSQRLADGASKSTVTAELARHWGVDVRLLPVTDDAIATELETEVGRLSFQDYFVRHRHDVVVHGIDVRGVEQARPGPDVLACIATSDRIIVAPSNPLLSIDPILRVPGVADALRARRDDVVAVSPLIGGAAVKGPADRVMRELGLEATCVGVATHYRDLVATLVIDEVDAHQASTVEAQGVKVLVTTTLMAEPANARRLAAVVLA